MVLEPLSMTVTVKVKLPRVGGVPQKVTAVPADTLAAEIESQPGRKCRIRWYSPTSCRAESAGCHNLDAVWHTDRCVGQRCRGHERELRGGDEQRERSRGSSLRRAARVSHGDRHVVCAREACRAADQTSRGVSREAARQSGNGPRERLRTARYLRLEAVWRHSAARSGEKSW